MTLSAPRALVGALLGAALVGTLLTSALATPAGAAAPARPQVGDCHSLTIEEYAATTDPDPRISCTRAHTSRTIAVKDVSAAAFRTSATLLATGVRVCTPAFARATGGSESNRVLSAYELSFFAPTRAQLDAGARWIRCDIVLSGGPRLLALPTDREPALGSAPHASSVARCLQLGSRSYRPTACSVTHNYRARGTLRIASSTYPGQDRLTALAARRCPSIARTRSWYATWPAPVGWKYGKERVMVCYANTRR